MTRVTWANGRGGSGTTTGTTSWTAPGIVLQLGTNVLTVTAQNAGGQTGMASVMLTRTPFTFTDDPLPAQGALIRAVHIMEFREAIDTVRSARGLASFAWTDPTIVPGSSPVKGIHLTELRTALNQAYQTARRPLPNYTDAAVVAGLTPIRAMHMNQLRAAVLALE